MFRYDKPRASWEMSGFDGVKNWIHAIRGKKFLRSPQVLFRVLFSAGHKIQLKKNLKGHILDQDLQIAQSTLKAPFPWSGEHFTTVLPSFQ